MFVNRKYVCCSLFASAMNAPDRIVCDSVRLPLISLRQPASQSRRLDRNPLTTIIVFSFASRHLRSQCDTSLISERFQCSIHY